MHLFINHRMRNVDNIIKYSSSGQLRTALRAYHKRLAIEASLVSATILSFPGEDGKKDARPELLPLQSCLLISDRQYNRATIPFIRSVFSCSYLIGCLQCCGKVCLGKEGGGRDTVYLDLVQFFFHIPASRIRMRSFRATSVPLRSIAIGSV